MRDLKAHLPLCVSLFAAALLFFVGGTLFCLMKSRRRRSYSELKEALPSVQPGTAPLLLVSDTRTTPRDVPFTLPPQLSSLRPKICFSVQYRPQSEQLVVSLLRLSHLPPALHSRPVLVELRLLPDDRRPLQAKARSTGPDPDFDLCLVFQVSPLSVPASVLVLSVLSVGTDGCHGRVGHVQVPLKGDLCFTGRVQWRVLQMHRRDMSPGLSEDPMQLMVSLCFCTSTHRLMVGVGGVKGQTTSTSEGLQIQVHLQSPSKLKAGPRPGHKTRFRPRPDMKTKCKPGPGWTEKDLHQIFSFQLKQRELEQSCVKIEVQNLKTEVLQALVLGPLLFSRGQQMDHWMEMISAPGKTLKRWHPLGPAS